MSRERYVDYRRIDEFDEDSNLTISFKKINRQTNDDDDWASRNKHVKPKNKSRRHIKELFFD